jgi:porin
MNHRAGLAFLLRSHLLQAYGVFCCLLPLAIATSSAGTIQSGADLTLDGAAGLTGGPRRGAALNGLVSCHAGWSNRADANDRTYADCFVSALGIFGEGPTGKFLGDMLTVSNAEGYQSLRLYTSWLEVHRDRLSWRVGLLLADEEFGYSEAGSRLVNASFGWPIYISANTINTGPAFFAAGAGMRVRLQLSEQASFLFGVFDGDTFDSFQSDPAVNRDGLHYRFDDRQGMFSIMEYGAQFDRGLRMKLGAWLHTGEFSDAYADEWGQSYMRAGTVPRRHRGNGGGYVVLEKAARGPAGDPGSIDLFLRAGTAPSDRNAIAWALDTGLAWYGPISERRDDVLVIGLTHARQSADSINAAMDANPGAPPPDYEQVAEISYQITLSARFTLQPDLQYIRHPGCSSAVKDALVVLVRAQVSL